MLSRREALRRKRPAGGVRIALIISGHGVHLILFRSNAAKQDAFHAYKMGLKGIVSKRLGSRYRSGRSPDWLKFKNPQAPAEKREAEEDWGQ
jgi:ATP-dependent DNA ligase